MERDRAGLMIDDVIRVKGREGSCNVLLSNAPYLSFIEVECEERGYENT